jgi:hypothetical protein
MFQFDLPVLLSPMFCGEFRMHFGHIPVRFASVTIVMFYLHSICWCYYRQCFGM